MKLKLPVLFLLVFAFGVSALGQDSDKPSWIPFARQSDGDTVRKSAFFDGGTGDEASGFHLPKWSWPSSSKKATKATGASSAAVTTKKPPEKSSWARSTFGTMGATTKKFWGETVDFLNPFDNKREPRQQGYQPQSLTESKEDSRFFSWLTPEPPESEPQSVNDFLRMPRPKF